jgi:hypothetical protein
MRTKEPYESICIKKLQKWPCPWTHMRAKEPYESICIKKLQKWPYLSDTYNWPL